MRAIGVTRFGGPDALQTVEITEPYAGLGEVRVRVTSLRWKPLSEPGASSSGICTSFRPRYRSKAAHSS